MASVIMNKRLENYKKILNKNYYKVIIFFILILFIQPIFGWELKKDKNGVKVFTRTIEGSNFKEFKSIGLHSGSLGSIISVLQDESNFCNWFPDCKEYRIIKKPSKVESYQYMVVKAPFPVNNRDTIQHSILSQDPVTKSVTIKLNATPEILPKVEGTIRVPKSVGYWKFSPLENNQVEVTFQLHSDPGGSLPEWLANIFVTESPHKALINLIKLASEEKYSSNKLDYILEK